MDMSKAMAYVLSGVLSGACVGMEECPCIDTDDDSSGFCISVSSSRMNSHQVIEHFRRGSWRADVDNNILRYLSDKARSVGTCFGSLMRHESFIMGTYEEADAAKSMISLLDRYFPAEDNQTRLREIYNDYKFNYGSGPCDGFYMSISLPGYENYAYALFDKNGWLVLFQLGEKEWHYSDMYYFLSKLHFTMRGKGRRRISYF